MLIAARTLRLRTSNKDVDVEVRLFKPINDNSSWICNYEIDWPSGIKKSYGAGADAIQAILIALQKIGTQLYTSQQHKIGALFWDQPGRGYGFPVSHNIRDLVVGDDLKL